jgi:hypothetical protein
MERAGSDHDQQAVIFLCDDARSLFATLDDCLLGVGWNGNLGGEELGWDEGVVSEN